MRCPQCSAEMPSERVPCGSCGWAPLDFLGEAFRNIEVLRAGGVRGITDPEEAAKSTAQQGIGAAMVLAQLGLITPDEYLEWVERLAEAAGIPYERLVRKVRASTSVEIEDEGGSASG